MLYKKEYIENNKKLKEENKQLKEELERQNKGIEALIFMSNKTKEENKRLKDTIKKTIELVEKADFGSDDNWVARHTGEGIIGAFTMVNTLQENILKILKGSDKE